MANSDNLVRDNTAATPGNFGKVRRVENSSVSGHFQLKGHMSLNVVLRGQELGETVKATYLNPARQHVNLARDTLITYTEQ